MSLFGQAELTDPEPRLLLNGSDPNDYGCPAAMHEGWMVGTWYWSIAGQQVVASFAWPVGDDEARLHASAMARKELIAYVQGRLCLRTDGHLGVVTECGEIPPPAQLAGIPPADYDYPGKQLLTMGSR